MLFAQSFRIPTALSEDNTLIFRFDPEIRCGVRGDPFGEIAQQPEQAVPEVEFLAIIYISESSIPKSQNVLFLSAACQRDPFSSYVPVHRNGRHIEGGPISRSPSFLQRPRSRRCWRASIRIWVRAARLDHGRRRCCVVSLVRGNATFALDPASVFAPADGSQHCFQRHASVRCACCRRSKSDGKSPTIR